MRKDPIGMALPGLALIVVFVSASVLLTPLTAYASCDETYCETEGCCEAEIVSGTGSVHCGPGGCCIYDGPQYPCGNGQIVGCTWCRGG
jgi:hypothetical protein